MNWMESDNDTIRRNWKKCSDAILAGMLSVSRDVLRAQRCKLGLFRKAPKGFVVQVTNWVSSLSKLTFCVNDMRRHGVAYIIAKCDYGQYALFREHRGELEFVPEPSCDKWVEQWCPGGENATGGG